MVGTSTTNGLCECGCGQLAPIISKNNAARGYVKGERFRFLPNHHLPQHDESRPQRVDLGYVTPCWILDIKPGRLGYVRAGGVQAHRLYWEQRNGPVPNGLELDHLCRRRACVNPDHLEPVTHLENIRRSVRPVKTHCVQGHLLDQKNLFVNKTTGWKGCKACRRTRSLAHYHKIKEQQKGGRQSS